jgi:multiphosphoryl transfer protein
VVGIVVVSHSRRLAEAAVELALQMVRGTPPPIEVAAGLDGHVLGTDAARVKEAIDHVASAEGVLVVMDLGSAVLSAELAIELRGDAPDCPIVLSDAPIVEGLVAAVTLAAAGAPLSEVAAEATQAGAIKTRLLGIDTTEAALLPEAISPVASIELVLHNEHGLHARPAARFVETVRRFDAEVRVRNITVEGAPVSGRSVSALSTLGVPAGHHIEVSASGRQAREALAAVAALVRRNFDETATGAVPPSPSPSPSPTGAGPFAASPGIGIGPKTSLPAIDLEFDDPAPGAPDVEADRLRAACDATAAELHATRDHVVHTAGEHEAAIFDAHLLLLEDDDLIATAHELIAAGTPAVRAWRAAVADLASRFDALADPYLRARADDVRAVGTQVHAHLMGRAQPSADVLAGVIVATDLTPAATARLDPALVQAIVTVEGSPTSHAAILARSLGIPAVVGAGAAILDAPDGALVIVDGTNGVVEVDPDTETESAYRARAASEEQRAHALLQSAARPALTTDGVAVHVVANIGSVADAVQAVQHGADAVGLLRTEFLFLDRTAPPDEDEQFESYLAIAQALEGRRLTVRTLDIGGDKPVPYLAVPAEANPFLGRRGLRLSLEHRDIFKQQLRALCRLALQHPTSVLFPMVSTVEELRTARALVFEAAAEVGGTPNALPPGLEVGAMAEVPAFALHTRAASALVDVISIGTNDLTQYTLAAERGNAAVSSLADALDPAVLRLISEVTTSATGRARVAVCGEVAADPAAAALLIGLGVRELSMAPPAIPVVKDAVRSLSLERAKRLADLALQRDSAASVRALLSDLA